MNGPRAERSGPGVTAFLAAAATAAVSPDKMSAWIAPDRRDQHLATLSAFPRRARRSAPPAASLAQCTVELAIAEPAYATALGEQHPLKRGDSRRERPRLTCAR